MSQLKRIFSKSRSLISRSSDSYSYIAFGIAIILLVTKISALFKLQLITSVFGIGKDLDLFLAANTIPEFIFTVVAIGAINASLIPILTQTSINEDESRLKVVFSSIVNVFFIVLAFLCLLVFIFAPQIIQPAVKLKIANVSASLSPEDIEKFIYLLRILILSPIILCVSSIFSSILQIKKKFFITALAPLFYNFGIIGFAIIAYYNHRNIEILAYGVVAGSFMHFLVQLPAIFRSRISYSPAILSINDVYVRKAIKQTLPRIIGLTSDYIGNIFQVLIAIGLKNKGSLSAFDIALSLREIPVSIFGTAISTSVFPSLAGLASQGRKEEFQTLFSKALRSILFWTLPVTALFIVLRTPIVRLLFGVINTNMSLEQTRLISYSLVFLSLGIVFYSLLNLVNRAFYAMDDSKTPTVVSILTICFELALTYALVNVFSNFDDSLTINPITIFQNADSYFTRGDSLAAIGGIGLASSISIAVNLGILVFFLNKKGVNVLYQSRHIVNKLLSTLAMLIVGIFSFKYFDAFFDTNRVIGVFLFTVNMTFIMLGTFIIVEKILGDDDIKILNDPIKRLKRSTSKFLQLLKTDEVTTGVA